MGIAHAVIGAGYGDEGKGLVTDYLARKFTGKNPIVVARCNGGAQAGHTVVETAGEPHRRHVFGHLSAGTFAGARTYLSSNFIVNPQLLRKEIAMLRMNNDIPDIIAHPFCRVTTVYDMAMNSLSEMHKRHGSCGVGINETVTRDAAGYALSLQVVKESGTKHLAKRLAAIRADWIAPRLESLEEFQEHVSEVEWPRYQMYKDMLDLDTMKLAETMQDSVENMELHDPKSFNLRLHQNLVVEGAQGLMIDEFLGEFPHVTRSVTGVASHITAAYECGYNEVQPIYVTRAYATRHGNGPLPFEGEHITDGKLYDSTNIENQWQGKLRYAPLNLDRMKQHIDKDFLRGLFAAQTTSTTLKNPVLVVTCLDQLGDFAIVICNGKKTQVATKELPQFIADWLEMKLLAFSVGPTANDVHSVEA